MFTYFTDRDGKFQLSALAESGFDPLARTTKFMLTEEAHHMFVGESGVARVLQRTAEVMNELGTDDPAKLRAAGVIDLPTIQRYLNFHYSVTIDLFGADQSSNAATFYGAGSKGRFEEGKRADDHRLHDATYTVTRGRRRQDRRKAGTHAECLERSAPRRLHPRLGRGHRALEPRARKGAHRFPAGCAAQGVQPQDRQSCEHPRIARRPRDRRSGMESARA
jgi:benzoyl-CoA oxygenase B subunit